MLDCQGIDKSVSDSRRSVHLGLFSMEFGF